MKSKQCHELCPYCGTDDVEYGDGRFEGVSYAYQLTCNKCKKISTEWYALSYDETTFEEENNE